LRERKRKEDVWQRLREGGFVISTGSSSKRTERTTWTVGLKTTHDDRPSSMMSTSTRNSMSSLINPSSNQSISALLMTSLSHFLIKSLRSRNDKRLLSTKGDCLETEH
jgi:hypothetical protein